MRAAPGGGDPHTLAGAYALDAIGDELERRRFEEHLTRCAECAQEIATLAETAARLGGAAAAEPPPELRMRVMAEIEQVRQAPPVVAASPGGRTRRSRAGEGPGWRLRLASAAAAVSVAAAAVFGVVALDARHRLEQERQAAREAAAVLAAPDARTATSEAGPAGRGTVVVSRARGRLVFLAADLAPLPGDRAYQVWQLSAARIGSAGLLSTDATGDALPLTAATGEGVTRLAVTVEPAGGSAQPTGRPLLVVDLPPA
ncbi:anti-sigma factor [Planomonospora venezuelensis]|uniref:Regulator of SigK n=1 Tax=Planomonospora venezuelensis TaxID=1999 RepID=A0A841DE00_PLAVE|nr:anti-sigma factor [Planomonospora venezuelensis]MBB5967003.1 anti-sigma-K factor RskA [Planomonospora venezuelensis]GIN01528.1 hypothetical protein Pve01_31860 [Planomonospora venezuelensis]